MLILLQPGIQPLGQFDLEDDDVAGVVGGEVAVFVSGVDDTAAADVTRPGPQVKLELGSAALPPYVADGGDAGSQIDDSAGVVAGAVWGLVDEGSSAGLGGRGYGTMFGQVIGATVGQGTGVGGLSSTGVVVVGPSTLRGSGKATLWTKPGLYGVTGDAFASHDPAVEADWYDAAAFNQKLFGNSTTGKLQKTADGGHVAYFLGSSSDTSFVSTPSYYAGVTTASTEFGVVYLVGCL